MLRTVQATRYVTPLREGGSLPAIVEADDCGLYVVKFRGAGQGPLALVAELPALAIDATRLEIFTRYHPEVPGHADVFFRDVLEVPERAPRLDDAHAVPRLERLDDRPDWERSRACTCGIAATAGPRRPVLALTVLAIPKPEIPYRIGKPASALIVFVNSSTDYTATMKMTNS